MNERQSDFEWLQQFARAGNQNAFRDLVRRHIDLVFATALHKVGDAGGAEEISQNVFSVLARKAWQFAPDDSLPAWLHKTALLESKHWLRGELRRRHREETAAELGTTMKTTHEQTAFSALVPLLDDGLLSLREKDRAALLLRFYEKQSLGAVGASLGVSEDTAQKRVQSALEKLSQFFQRRGYKTATVAAATAAMQHTAATASAATLSLVANAAIKSAPPVLAGLGAVLARFATLTKVQTAAVCIAIAVVPLAWKWEHIRQTKNAVANFQVKLTAVNSESADASAELEKMRQQSARLDQEQADAMQNQAPTEQAVRKLAELKTRSRVLLTNDNYRWPDDLPFVRVPKSALASINVGGGPNSPEKLATKIDQFLDLSAQEREITSQIFTNYFAELDRVIQSGLYETNRSSLIALPAGAESKVFGLLPIGEKIRAAMSQLGVNLEAALGSERWAMVKPDEFEFTHYEQVRLLGYTQYNWDKQQEMAVCIFEKPGAEPSISLMGSDGAGGSLRPLDSWSSLFFSQGPPMLVERVKSFCSNEAEARLSKHTTK